MNYNLFAWDLGLGMVFGFEMHAGGRFRQLTVWTETVGPRDWHDIVVRYDGRTLGLFVDGMVRDRESLTGRPVRAPSAPCLIGADPGGENPFRGVIDHAALWDRALNDDEIRFLSGGTAAVEERGRIEDDARREREEKTKVGLEALRRRIAANPRYPKYHVAPPGGWMNDPHPIYFKGVYHIFYQYSCLPDHPYGGPHRWGHAASSDLVHWKHLPVAISPEDHGAGEDRHIWSGCVVDDGGVGTAIYTIENIDVWISRSLDDDLLRWKKIDGNPVIEGPPPGLAIEGGMRDPWVWKEEDAWYLIVGSGLSGRRGPVLPLYRSTDLVDWQYLHPLFEGDAGGDIGNFCECPTFFALGAQHVLALSHQSSYFTGRYKDHRFIPERRGRLDHGIIYVPQFVLDGEGRRIMWGWVTTRHAPTREAQVEDGWAGMQTLPRVVSLAPDGTLRQEPAPELASLRRMHTGIRDVTLPADASRPVEGVKGAQLEVRAVLLPGGKGTCGLELRGDPERVEIGYDAAGKTLRCGGRTAPLELERDEPLDLRVFFDASVVEVFANRRVCITESVRMSDPEAVGLGLFARGGGASVRSLDAWTMGSIWPEP